MVSSTHEVLVEIVRRRPRLVAELLSGSLGVALPAFDTATLEPAEIVDLAPTEYRADAVVALSGDAGPVQQVVVEVQLRPDGDKRFSWPVYLATLRARSRCPAVLLVVCVDEATAAWARTAIELGHPGLVLAPLVIGPSQVPDDPGLLTGEPEVAVLAALTHGRGRHEILDVFATALAGVETELALLYLRLVMSGLPVAARTHLEDLMTTETFAYQSEFTERLRDEGRNEGRNEGRIAGLVEAKVDDVLRVLRVRGIAVPETARDRIVACSDLDLLDAWHDRAVTAATIDDLGV